MSTHRLLAAPPAELSSLDLPALRAYRRTLRAEEDRVSYWRRLFHGRMDVLLAQSRTATALTFDELVFALGDTGAGRRRQALLRVAAEQPLPELPELESIWMDDVDLGDAVEVEKALDRLRAGEAQLGEYRAALHSRIEEANEQLIARYREDPRAALQLIPSG
jgi:hypothetical protein